MKKTAKKKPAKKAAKKTPTKKAPAKKKASTTTKKKTTKKQAPPAAAFSDDVAATISKRIEELGGWRGPVMARMRALIKEADPEIVEERKWVKPSNPHGVPTYSHGGLVATLEVYKEYVKVTFAYGSKIPDPKNVFNASLLGLRRAVDVREGQSVDANAFKDLVRAAVKLNLSK